MKRGKVNAVSAHTPQVEYNLEEKDNIWNELDDVMHSISKKEITGANLVENVSEGNRGNEKMIRKNGTKKKNEEEQMIVDFEKRKEVALLNINFMKKEEHRVTYKSGGRISQTMMSCAEENN